MIAVTMWLACSVAMSGCGKGKERAALATKLEQRIQAASATGGDVLLTEVTDFDWDTFHIFTPYVGAEEVRKWLGIDWSGARDVPEMECLLVFVKGGEVVMDLDFSRTKGDFSSIRKSRFTREEARFTAPKDGKALTHASDSP
ncbi:hypothetical protein [Myxococcus llanfairpwllgwyngyllgogerychwyrndrobwllllantysiliogogogochensis]|nr:hypothetical protein [Myxococcus llanfairpwllgwyngyllgogerychwyrndrobwllllantysiliogogogochensis]